jgi:TonB family protein
MKPVDSSWPRGAWFWGFIFLFLAHALAVFWLAERRQYKSSWQKPRAFLYLGGNHDYDRQLAQAAALRDPTLFALPHAQGFSGGAWRNFQPQFPALTNWSAQPEWLPLESARLGLALQEYVTTNRPSESRLLASLRATRLTEVRLADEPILTNSTLQVEGGVNTRRLISRPALPSVPLSDLPGRTIVAVSVNGDGTVESASVSRESASKWADQRALELAGLLEFEPLPIRNVRARRLAPPTVLRVIFAWHAVPPTNNAVTASTK